TKTDAGCEPLLLAMERFFEQNRSHSSQLEQHLFSSACEAVREIVAVASFKAHLRGLDVRGLARCLRHPIRLLRGIYFEKRRSLMLGRRMRIAIALNDDPG